MSASQRSPKKQNAGALSAFGRLLLLIWRMRPMQVSVLLALLCLEGVLPPAGLVLARRTINAIIEGMRNGAAGSLVGNPELQSLLLIGTGLAAVLVVLDVLTTLLQQLIQEALIPEMNVQLAEKAARVELVFYEQPAFYDVLNQAEREIGTRPIQVLQQIPNLIQSTITLTGFMLLLIGLNPLLALVLLMAGLPALYIQRRLSQQMFRQWKRQTPLMRWATYYRGLLTTQAPAIEIRVFRLADELISRLKAAFGRIQLENTRLLRRYTLGGGSVQLFTVALYWGAFAWTVDQALRGRMSVGDVVLFSAIVLQMRTLVQSSVRSLGLLNESSLFISNYFDFLDLESDRPLPLGGQSIPASIASGFMLENISFTYPGAERPALQNIYLALRPGERVAIVGANGAGKSTLVKLLARLYEPTSGRITLDGIDLGEYNLDDYRSHFSMIVQNFVQYHLPVVDNIGFGSIDRLHDHAAIQEAAQLSNADDFIRALPDGYNTQLGRSFERSTQLSGGEWQKLALARAYLPSSQILVLDEPSASLDVESEAKLVEQYAQLSIGQIAILISHRFSTVRLADRIIVLDEGRLVEDGTHDELMQAGGLYAAMFRTQASAYDHAG
jgi:ATP-binding cassette, subfamily B, bacterial